MISNSNLKKIFCWLLVLAWSCIIFGFSSQDGSQSGGLSGKIVDIILNLFKIDATEDIYNNLQFIVRKLAHFTEYFILGVLTFNAFCHTFDNLKKASILSFLFCAIYSITDEFHQSFIPERVASVKDCIIDSTGAFIGISICIIAILIFKPANSKNINKI